MFDPYTDYRYNNMLWRMLIPILTSYEATLSNTIFDAVNTYLTL